MFGFCCFFFEFTIAKNNKYFANLYLFVTGCTKFTYIFYLQLSLTMETLLDQADALVLSAGEEGPEKPPNFELPEELVQFTKPNPTKLEIRDTRHKGCGWFTKKDIPAGEIVLVSKPLVCTLDLECIDSDDEIDVDVDVDVDVNGNTAEQDDDEPYDSRANELLVVDVLQRIIDVPSIWSEQLTNLYPRESTDIESSPVWISKDDTVLSQFEAMIDGIERNVAELKGKSKEISRRLPLIIRYNVLSIETCPELLSHPGINGHHKLSGVVSSRVYNHRCTEDNTQ